METIWHCVHNILCVSVCVLCVRQIEKNKERDVLNEHVVVFLFCAPTVWRPRRVTSLGAS